MVLEVRAQVGGSIWSHVASIGQRVDAGAVLLILECMKTEFPIESPVAATVTWLLPCGEAVEADDVVARLDP